MTKEELYSTLSATTDTAIQSGGVNVTWAASVVGQLLADLLARHNAEMPYYDATAGILFEVLRQSLKGTQETMMARLRAHIDDPTIVP